MQNVKNVMNSRVGRKSISIPNKVSISFDRPQIHIKGPKGEIKTTMDKRFSITVEEGKANITPPVSGLRSDNALFGLYRALLQNMVTGVSTGYKKELQLIGVGYKASVVPNTNILEMNLGYSHNIYFQVPEEIKVETKTEKNKAPLVILESFDKQLIGQVAAKIKSLRKTEPYKGKGIREVGEFIIRKEGKTTAKK